MDFIRYIGRVFRNKPKTMNELSEVITNEVSAIVAETNEIILTHHSQDTVFKSAVIYSTNPEFYMKNIRYRPRLHKNGELGNLHINEKKMFIQTRVGTT